MTSRERFVKALHFEEVDRPPLMEFWWYEQETIERWFKEGLAISKPHASSNLVAEMFTQGFVHWPDVIQITDHFGIDLQIPVSLDALPLPRFQQKVISEDADSKIYMDLMGCKVQASKSDPRAYGYLESPVKTLDDLKELKKRYNPLEHSASMRRSAWTDQFVEHLKTTDQPVGLYTMGLFRQAQYLLGAEHLLVALYENPELIHEFFNFWANYIIEHSKQLLQTARIDYALLTEDMAYNKGSQISAAHYREFMLPYHRKIADHFKNFGVDIIMIDCAGDLNELIPLYLEAGFNCQCVLQASAGVDAVALRKKYGKRLALIGNLSLEQVIAGGDHIEKEISSKVPWLIKQGGYIPSLDDIVSPDVPHQHYIQYVNVMHDILGNGKRGH